MKTKIKSTSKTKSAKTTKYVSLLTAIMLMVTGLFAGMMIQANAAVGEHQTQIPTGYIAINNKADLLTMMQYGIDNRNVRLTNNYILMSNIEFVKADFEEGGDFFNSGKCWAPLGIMVSYPYAGTFDGNGYTIKGLKVNNSNFNEEANCGFIGINEGTVKNLTIEDASFAVTTGGEPNLNYANAYGGGVVGLNAEKGIVMNCSSNAEISAISTTVNAYAGGIAGCNYGLISNCSYTGPSIKASTTSDRTDRTDKATAGGITALNSNSSLFNVFVGSSAKIEATASIEKEGNEVSGAIAGFSNVMAVVKGAYYPQGAEPITTGVFSKAICIPLASGDYTNADAFYTFDFTNIWEMGTSCPILRVNGTNQQEVPDITPRPSVPVATATASPNGTQIPETTAAPTDSGATPSVSGAPDATATPAPTPKVAKVSVRFAKKSVSLRVKKKITLKLTVKNAKKGAKAKFSIANKKIARIVKKTAKNVTLKGIKKGKTTVSAKLVGKKASCKVNVKK